MQAQFLTLLAVILLTGTAQADRALEPAEILQVLEALTSQPRKTWISSGTMRASHEEYRAPKITDSNEISDRIGQEIQAYLDSPEQLELDEELQKMKLEAIPFNVRYRLSNEYTMNSETILKSDGSRFYWEIDVISRLDSVRPTVELEANFLTEEFDLSWNQSRVFAWDGEKYVVYFRPGNHAIVTDLPGGINGPLTAGIVPWGYGRYSYERLSSAELSAIEVKSDDQSEIHLTVVDGDERETFILDLEKDNALKFYTAVLGNSPKEVRTYTGYQLVGDSWCPGNIVIEQHDTTADPNRLVARDIWDFISIGADAPEPESFNVDYQYDALIEDFRFGSEPLQYRYLPPLEPLASGVKVDRLLQSRLVMTSALGSPGQNCATGALKYVCGALGQEPSWRELGQLVHGNEKSTSLFAMQQFLHNLGLNSLVVKTNLETLKALRDSYAILHLPRDNHYVVLGNIDDKYVRIIDLDKNNFYYRDSTQHFDALWGNVAMVIDNEPIAIKGDFVRLDGSQLHRIIGADECQQCNTEIQPASDDGCSYDGRCCGTHTIYFRRIGCGDASSGTCFQDSLIRSMTEPCNPDPHTCECAGTGEWTSDWIPACD